MKTLLLLISFALSACSKPDAIEACVEAMKKRDHQQFCSGDVKCSSKDWSELITAFEADWRKECMMAAAGKGV
jgi:hypothetical protein